MFAVLLEVSQTTSEVQHTSLRNIHFFGLIG